MNIGNLFLEPEAAMDTQITTFFVLCCELLNALNIHDNSQAEMSSAEVMTVVLTAAAFFGGNFRRAAVFLEEYGCYS